MVHINDGILLRHEREWNFTICKNMEGPIGYYAKGNKSDIEKQILYAFSSVWYLKNKTNKQTKQKNPMDKKNKLMVARWEACREMDDKGAGIKKYKLAVRK